MATRDKLFFLSDQMVLNLPPFPHCSKPSNFGPKFNFRKYHENRIFLPNLTDIFEFEKLKIEKSKNFEFLSLALKFKYLGKIFRNIFRFLRKNSNISKSKV